MVTTFFDKLNDSSFFTFFVPFLLVFAIMFGILSKINLFKRDDDKDKGKRINMGISLVVGLIFASVSLATDCLSAILPKFAIVLIVLLIFYMIMGFIIDVNDNKSLFNIILGILVAIGFVIILFMSSEACGLKIGSLNWIIGDWWKWVVGVIIVGGLFAWMLKGSKKPGEKEKPKPKQKQEEPQLEQKQENLGEDEPELY